MATKIKKQYALVAPKTDYGRSCLRDINGLKTMDLVEGKLSVDGKAFEFKHNGTDAVLWLEHNCIIIEPDYNTVVHKGYVIQISVAVCDSTGNIIEEFDTLKEAKKYIKGNGSGEILFLAAEWLNP